MCELSSKVHAFFMYDAVSGHAWETFLSGVWGFNVPQTHTHTACLCVIVTTGFVNKQFELLQLHFVTISILSVNLSGAE